MRISLLATAMILGMITAPIDAANAAAAATITAINPIYTPPLDLLDRAL